VIIYKGEVVAATAGRAENVADAFQAELMAAVHALRLAEQSYTCYSGDGFTPPNVGVEYNYRSEADASSQAMILDDLKFQVRTNYSLCNVIACKRELNKVAHEPARIGWSCDVNRVLL
jgi:hypothetical protein